MSIGSICRYGHAGRVTLPWVLECCKVELAGTRVPHVRVRKEQQQNEQNQNGWPGGAGGRGVRDDGSEVGVWTAAELVGGGTLGFNERTPQYRQAQAVAEEIAALARREAKPPVRRYEIIGVDVDDKQEEN